ncbi:MAG TPA: DUF3592 domain-containing protein, partial [Streptosporangiaceae bacterium]
MGRLIGRRAVRHLLLGLGPLLILGIAVIVVLLVRFAQIDAPVRRATASATATVVRSGFGASGHDLDLRWTDSHGTAHVSQVTVPDAGPIATGSKTTIQYNPDDPAQVFVEGDSTSVRLRNTAFGAFITLIVVLAAVAVSIVHVVRRLLAERREPATLPATYARSKRGLIYRSWLLLEDRGREHWVPVHWEPALATMLAKTPSPVRGRPGSDRVVVVDVRGTAVWQSGRIRRTQPAGDITIGGATYTKAAQRRIEAEPPPTSGLARQARTDAVLVLAAPLLGLLWAFLDRTGPAGFAAGTVVAVGV